MRVFVVWMRRTRRRTDERLERYFYHRCTSRQGTATCPRSGPSWSLGRTSIRENPSLGRLPCTAAIYFDKPVTLKVLIEAGADVNAQDSDGATPLTLAAQEDNPMIVMELIKAGADVNLTRHDGATPLHMAAQNGHEGCAAGADPRRRRHSPTYRDGQDADYIRHR